MRQRFGAHEDIAKAVLIPIASDSAYNILGVVIGVDGGISQL
jgi:NAD(P)-dependent dehydrogenase (short-subunit alcohol dehydrogenase family)